LPTLSPRFRGFETSPEIIQFRTLHRLDSCSTLRRNDASTQSRKP
jgi:hypothetical protein